ncbi:hypothetical protein ACIOJ9_39275 [Streptomyces sp. NPDC088175]|uniref:hypothetical protein n=1 Tax=unclassified Streptomyces TaxID=2593676 RepID=UPI003819EB50
MTTTPTTAPTTAPSAPASTSTTAPTTPVPPATAPAVPPEARRPDRALWAVVLLLCGGCVAYAMREHPTLTEPVTGAATVTLAVTGVVQWLRRS